MLLVLDLYINILKEKKMKQSKIAFTFGILLIGMWIGAALSLVGETPTIRTEPYTYWDALMVITNMVALFWFGRQSKD
jgi:nicotinamide riboside transporter PnuC